MPKYTKKRFPRKSGTMTRSTRYRKSTLTRLPNYGQYKRKKVFKKKFPRKFNNRMKR